VQITENLINVRLNTVAVSDGGGIDGALPPSSLDHLQLREIISYLNAVLGQQ
jgi:hypothetical protein